MIIIVLLLIALVLLLWWFNSEGFISQDHCLNQHKYFYVNGQKFAMAQAGHNPYEPSLAKFY